MRNLEQKTARLTVLIDPSKKKAFEALCASQDVTPSQVVRRLIRDHLRSTACSGRPARSTTSSRRRWHRRTDTLCFPLENPSRMKR